MSKRKVRKYKQSCVEKNVSVSELMNEKESKKDWEPTLDLPPGYPEVQDLGGGNSAQQSDHGSKSLVTKNLITEFKNQNLEVQLCMGGSTSLFLVPEYTGKDRLELSVDHFALISTLTNSATGSQIVSIRRLEGTSASKQTEN